MTDVNIRTASGADTTRLNTLRVAELQALAGELGLQGASKLRKGELVVAIAEIQSRTVAGAAPETTEAVTEPKAEPAERPQP